MIRKMRKIGRLVVASAYGKLDPNKREHSFEVIIIKCSSFIKTLFLDIFLEIHN